MDFLKMMREHLERILSENHPDDHEFQPDAHDPSECAKCGWMGPDGPKQACGKTRREHMVELLQAINDGKVTVGEPVIITYRFAYRPFSWSDYLFGRYW